MADEAKGAPIASMLTVVSVAVGAGAQLAYARTSYNLPHNIVQQFLNDTLCPGWCKFDSSLNEVFLTFAWTTIVAAHLFGEVPALLTGRWLADRFGRKGVIFWSGVPAAGGLALQALAKRVGQLGPGALVTGRFLHGLGVGWLQISSRLFINEVNPQNMNLHKSYMSGYALTMPIFQLLGFPNLFGGGTVWPYLNAIAAVPLALMMFVIVFVPESPRFLHRIKAQEHKIVQSVQFYMGPAVWPQEYLDQCIRDEPIGSNVRRGFASIKDAWKKSVVQRTVVSVVLVAAAMQSLGLSMISTMFSAEMLTRGLQIAYNEALMVVIVAFLLGLLSLAITHLFHKNVSRRAFLLISVGGMVICYFLFFGVAFVIQYIKQGVVPGYAKYLGAAFFAGSVVFFYLGLARVPWYLAQENLSSVSRIPTLTLGYTIGRGLELICVVLFPIMFQVFGLGWAGLPLHNLLAFGFIYLAFFCPYYETRKKVRRSRNSGILYRLQDEKIRKQLQDQQLSLPSIEERSRSPSPLPGLKPKKESRNRSRSPFKKWKSKR